MFLFRISRGIPPRISSWILPEILFKTSLSEFLYEFAAGGPSGIASKDSPGTPQQFRPVFFQKFFWDSSGVSSGIRPGVFSKVFFKNSEVYAETFFLSSFRILSEIPPRFLYEISSGVPTGNPKIITFGNTPGIPPGISQRIHPGITTQIYFEIPPESFRDLFGDIFFEGFHLLIIPDFEIVQEFLPRFLQKS